MKIRLDIGLEVDAAEHWRALSNFYALKADIAVLRDTLERVRARARGRGLGAWIARQRVAYLEKSIPKIEAKTAALEPDLRSLRMIP